MKLTTSAIAAILGFSLQVSAQTSSDCNPTKQSCPADPALGGTGDFDFTKGKSDRFPPSGGDVKYDGSGASLTIGKKGDAPTLISDFYIMFGSVEWTLKIAPGQGVVSSAVLLSDCLDEIDFEWLGGDAGQVQSNYFAKGNTESFDRVEFHANAGSQEDFHTYSVDWTSERIKWDIDGNNVRNLPAEKAGDNFPQTPMRIKAGIWAGGDPGNEDGTIEWAGGPIDYSGAPYTMQVKSIKVTDYSTGKEYVYSDKSGTWQSIESNGGKVNPNGTPGSGPEVGSSSPAPDPTQAPSTTTQGMQTTSGPDIPSEYPWIPNSPTTLETEVASITSLAGLPSSWIITDTGRATTPSTAAETSQSSSQSSPSSSDSSSAGGSETTSDASSSPSSDSTSSGFITSQTSGAPDEPTASDEPTPPPGGNATSTEAPPVNDNAAVALSGMHRSLAAAICLMAGWMVLL